MKRSIILILLVFATFCEATAQDQIETQDGPLSIQPIMHGTVVFSWNDQLIYVDPYGGADAFADFDDPDVILITHPHGDHLNMETLTDLNTNDATIVVPQSVADELPESFNDQLVILSNGETTDITDIDIRAVPMYNLPEDEDPRHPKGWGNGYVLTMGGTDVYVSGDTEDIPEMRNLQNIDVAFVCMNLPYTMDINQAASAVLDFEPDIVYPYHHRGQDIEAFRKLVVSENDEIEVRLRNWYPEQ